MNIEDSMRYFLVLKQEYNDFLVECTITQITSQLQNTEDVHERAAESDHIIRMLESIEYSFRRVLLCKDTFIHTLWIVLMTARIKAIKCPKSLRARMHSCFDSMIEVGTDLQTDYRKKRDVDEFNVFVRQLHAIPEEPACHAQAKPNAVIISAHLMPSTQKNMTHVDTVQEACLGYFCALQNS